MSTTRRAVLITVIIMFTVCLIAAGTPIYWKLVSGTLMPRASWPVAVQSLVTDAVNEATLGAGVTIDGLLCKDLSLGTTGTRIAKSWAVDGEFTNIPTVGSDTIDDILSGQNVVTVDANAAADITGVLYNTFQEACTYVAGAAAGNYAIRVVPGIYTENVSIATFGGGYATKTLTISGYGVTLNGAAVKTVPVLTIADDACVSVFGLTIVDTLNARNAAVPVVAIASDAYLGAYTAPFFKDVYINSIGTNAVPCLSFTGAPGALTALYNLYDCQFTGGANADGVLITAANAQVGIYNCRIGRVAGLNLDTGIDGAGTAYIYGTYFTGCVTPIAATITPYAPSEYAGAQYTDTIYERTAAAGVTIDGVLCKDNEVVAGSGGNTTTLDSNGNTLYAGTNRPISYIYPFESIQPFAKDWAGAADHNVIITTDDYDPTSVAITANGASGGVTDVSVKAISNAADDYNYVTWVFHLPQNFAGFADNPLIETHSTDFANTEILLYIAVNGTIDANFNGAVVTPAANNTWTSYAATAYAGAYTTANAGQLMLVRLKFTGDAADVMNARNLRIGYYRVN